MAREGITSRLGPQRFPAPQRAPSGNIEEVLRAVEHYHLDEHSSAIGPLARNLSTARHSTLSDGLAHALRARVQPFLEYHRERPCVTVPGGVMTGPITLGVQVANQARVGITLDDINLHGTIVGPSGSGKTTILRHIAEGLLAQGIQLGLIDIKEDFGWLLRRSEVLLIDETAPWNFLTAPAFLTPAEHREEVIDLLLTRFYGGASQRAILDEGWQRAASKHSDFSIADWISAIDDDGSPKERFSRADARQGAIARLRRFAQHTAFTTRAGIPWESLLTSTFVVRARGFDDVARFQFDLLARYAFLRNRSRHQTGLQLVLLVDESYDLMAAEHDGIRAIETLPRLKQLGREFGIGVITTTVTLNGLSDLARASTHFHIALPPNNQEEARALIRVLGLNDAEATYFLRRMQRGEALLRIGTWPEVIHLQIPPNTERKHATPEDITSARTRTSQRATGPNSPTASLTERSTGPARGDSNGQPPTAQAPSAVAAVATEPLASNTPRRVALNKHAAALLADVADHPLTLTTTAYDRCGLHWTQGDRAKALLTKLALLEAHKVTTGAGRGKTGSALRVMPAGWGWLGRTPPKGTRGGDSVQHAFLVHELARRIPTSCIETLGSDLVIPYNTRNHHVLLHELKELAAQDVALNDGALITLECEVSAPAKTVPRNVQRDAGFALTIIATLPKHLTLARRLVAHNEAVIVVDVLRLLDALRPTEER